MLFRSHGNSHPDFLWIPKRGTFASSKPDYEKFTYTGKTVPDATVTELAARASESGMPLCRVVNALVRESSGKDGHLGPP